MADLVPVPLPALVARLLGELERTGGAFDLPSRSFLTSTGGRDLSVSVFGQRAASPFGPAAGPHTQLAQNVALGWLAGGRMIELKTVQARDDLVIPRPCIDAGTIGYNVEWSQELRLDQSLEEYVKAAMLVALLQQRDPPLVEPSLHDTIFDLSVGYDLAGIRTQPVRAFLDGMLDATPHLDRLRRQLPPRLRDLAVPRRLAERITLSTFHGCPPGEIEAIGAYLLEEVGVHLVVKLNPTLLGADGLRALLGEQLGYRDLTVPAEVLANDTTWDQAVGIVGRLGERARRAGRGFGVKLTNTLVVENRRPFLPTSERFAYLSGAPLHVLAMALVQRFRRTFGDAMPVSFSGGIDATNFADAVALGLAPISASTDLLKPGGYGRAKKYATELFARMDAVGARDLATFTLRAHGQAEAALEGLDLDGAAAQACRAALASGGDLRAAAGPAFEAWVSRARVLNTDQYVAKALADPRYAAPRNSTPPKKVGSRLALFDCLTCDKCIPVCPNDANFSLAIPQGTIPVERLIKVDGGWRSEAAGVLTFAKPRQIANFADACNECGHCDVMCPEEGGPYAVKPRFFGSADQWAAHPKLDGFALERAAGGQRMLGRLDGRAYAVVSEGARLRYSGPGFDVALELTDPAGTASGRADGPVDLTPLRIMEALRRAVLDAGPTTWPGALLEAGG